MRAADQELAHLTSSDVPTVFIDHPDVQVEVREAHRAGLADGILGIEREAVGTGLGEPVALLEGQAATGVGLDQGDGAGRAARDEEANGGEVHGREGGGFEHHLEHGRHREDHGAALPLDELKGLGSVELPHQDHGPAPVKEGRGEDVQAAGVEEGGMRQGDVVVTEVPADLGVDGVPGDGPMSQDSPLGLAGRARGVENQPGIVQVDLGGLRDVRSGHGEQLLVRGQKAVLVEGDHVLQRELGQDRLHRALELGAEEEEARLGVLEDVLELGLDQAVIEGHHEGAELAQREEEFEGLGAVVGQDRDAITLPDAIAVAQGGSELVGALVEAPVRQPAAGGHVDEGGLLGGVERPAAQPVTKVHRGSSITTGGSDWKTT
ncbi:hypothetical protein D3C87_982850 [compost metagenome]